jgi:hypothetical protein
VEGREFTDQLLAATKKALALFWLWREKLAKAIFPMAGDTNYARVLLYIAHGRAAA